MEDAWLTVLQQTCWMIMSGLGVSLNTEVGRQTLIWFELELPGEGAEGPRKPVRGQEPGMEGRPGTRESRLCFSFLP